MPVPAETADERRSFWRLETFSDSIFAVAMTLLVFSFPLSALPADISEAGVATLLEGLWPQFETFIISFIVVGAFWIGHHRVLDDIERYDRTFVWLNFLFLLFIVFTPFPTAILVRGTHWLSVAFYAITIAGAGVALTLMRFYASYHHRLIDKRMPAREIRFRTISTLVTPSIFLISIVIALYSPRLAMYSWLLSFVVQWAVTRQRQKSKAY